MAWTDYDGLEHGLVLPRRLPPKHARTSHYDDKPFTTEQFGVGVQQARRHGMKSPQAAQFNHPSSTFQKQSNSRRNERLQRPRNQWNSVSGGPGMQAIFLGSGPRSNGTGVFLPRRQGSDVQNRNKPAYSPVLLPSSVVQALNLDVHELGQHNKPEPVHQRKNTAKETDEAVEEKGNKSGDDDNLSPEDFLPKEWTY